MDCTQIGALIYKLRKEKGLTQKDVADALNINHKTVSKWECGRGCPDLCLWAGLSDVLGADVKKMLEGEIFPNKPDNGNINKIVFYVCPICGNVLASTSGASISCCGKKLKALLVRQGLENHPVQVQEIDDYYYVSLEHEMQKSHYIMFVAYVESDKFLLNRLYPEQTAATQIPQSMHGGRLYVYCSQHGLYTLPLSLR